MSGKKLFSAKQIEELRAGYGKLEKVDPCGPAYAKLIGRIKAMERETLLQVREAGIKWLSYEAGRELQERNETKEA